MNSRVNLLIACWGDRRRTRDALQEEDYTHYLRLQVETLSKYGTGLSQITLISNGGVATYRDFLRNSPWDSWMPAPTRIIERHNVGYSNGAWYHGCKAFPGFDYYIFLEDDYVFTKVAFPAILIELYEFFPNCGYLCSYALQAPPTEQHPNVRFPSALNGIIGQNVLRNLNPAAIGMNATIYMEAERDGQMGWGYALKDYGFEVYDTGERYQAPFIDQYGNLDSHYPNAPEFLVVPAQFYRHLNRVPESKMTDQQWSIFRQRYLAKHNVYLPDSARWKFEARNIV